MKFKWAAQIVILKIKQFSTVSSQDTLIWYMLRNDSGENLKAFCFYNEIMFL